MAELAAKAIDKVPKTSGFHMIPKRALFALADHYAKGAAKYAAYDWEKGRKWSDYYDALFRHATAWWEGERLDEDGHHNLIACAWLVLALFTFEETHPELDDRPETGGTR
jgi:hypothetical protein